jgi:hypothetical protein
MIPLPKPRGFWDYSLFALTLTGPFVLLFWLQERGGFGWADVALALAASALMVSAAIFARRGERAAWIARPTWQARLLAVVGAVFLIFWTVFADTYFLHRRDLTASRFRVWIVVFIAWLTAQLLWLAAQPLLRGRGRSPAGRESL